MHVCFCCVCFSFSVLSQQLGWEERFRNDLFDVGWDVKPQLNQSVNYRVLSGNKWMREKSVETEMGSDSIVVNA